MIKDLLVMIQKQLKVFMRRFIYVSILLTFSHYCFAELSLTHTLSPLKGEWVYVRASEASTLFIETKNKANETFFEIVEIGNQPFFKEYSKNFSKKLPIADIKKSGNEIEIFYQEHSIAPAKTLIYPYRDIPEAWVIIHFNKGEENKVHFITSSKNLPKIEYYDE